MPSSMVIDRSSLILDWHHWFKVYFFDKLQHQTKTKTKKKPNWKFNAVIKCVHQNKKWMLHCGRETERERELDILLTVVMLDHQKVFDRTKRLQTTHKMWHILCTGWYILNQQKCAIFKFQDIIYILFIFIYYTFCIWQWAECLQWDLHGT